MHVRLYSLLATAVGFGIVVLALFQALRAPERLALVELSQPDVVVEREGGTAPTVLQITNLGRKPVRCVGLGLCCTGAECFHVPDESLHTVIEPGTSHGIACTVSCPIDRELAFEVRVYLADAEMTWETVLSVTVKCRAPSDESREAF